MFGCRSRQRIEGEMAAWLAHPNEFGVKPRSVPLLRTYKGNVITHGQVEIHLVAYEMPNGATGRGFVNGSLTWVFFGDEVNAICDDDLLVAYCGWAWLFPALQGGSVETEFLSLREEHEFRAKKEATRNGKQVRGAGNKEAEVSYDEDDPRFNFAEQLLPHRSRVH